MKKVILLCLLAICSNNLLALEFNKKYSFDTYVFLQQAENKALKANLKQKYFLQAENEAEYTKIFVKIGSEYSKEALAALNTKEILKTKSVALLAAPVAAIPHLAALHFIERIEVATQVYPMLDSALDKTNADLVQAGAGLKQAYSGAGVILGVVDYGFDFTHPMFSDAAGKCRVTRAWIPEDDSGTPPFPDWEGTLYTNSEELKSKVRYTSKGNYHASHVLGIAAGSKVKTVNTGQYFSGVATGAEIAVVECEGTTINEGLYYLLSYADSVDKPLVVNMSLGSIGGPGDGQELRDLQISEMLNYEPEGNILVVSAGNSGNTKLHIEHEFEDESQSIHVYQQFKPYEGTSNTAYAFIDIWGEPGDAFEVDAYMYADDYPDTVHVETLRTNDDTLIYGQVVFDRPTPAYIILAQLQTESKYAGNNRPYVRVMLQDNSYSWAQTEMLPWTVKYKITSKNGTKSHIHCWNPLRYNSLRSDEVEADTYYSLGSPGTIPEVITVGAYVSNDTMRTLIAGNWPNSSGKLNEISNFSSKGPLTNGLIKPDITAPGSLVSSAYNYYDTSNAASKERGLIDYVEDAATNNQHVIYPLQGTSMSSPVVAGIVALMLELNPKLTQTEIKDILRITAINDEWTGDVRDNKSVVCGWGKINALAIMKELEGTSIDDLPDFGLEVFPNPLTNNFLNIQAQNETGAPYIINVYDNSGKLVYLSSITDSKQINLSTLPAGNYFIELYNHKAKALQKFVKL